MKLSWVISNLIGNALRYTPEGGTIQVAAAPSGSDFAQLEVADSGPGIAPEIRDHVFERFAQYGANGYAPGLGRTRTRDRQGHRRGARRTHLRRKQQRPRQPLHRATPGRGTILMARLLIVDDEKNIRLSLVRFFDSLGHHVARRKMARTRSTMLAESRFDLVLTDFRMAEMNGLELLQGGEAASSRQPRHPDDCVCDRRKRGRRDEGRRLRLRHQAILARRKSSSSSSAQSSCRACRRRIANCARRWTTCRCSTRACRRDDAAVGDRADRRPPATRPFCSPAKAAPARTSSRARSIAGVCATIACS